MRGFDYYTGIVFEVFDTDPPNNRSVLGGDRWLCLGRRTPAKLSYLAPPIACFVVRNERIVALVGDVAEAAQTPITELRAAGLNVAVDLSSRKLGDQFKTAEKKGLSGIVIIGENELKDGVYTLKNLANGDSLTDLIERLRALKSSYKQPI